MAVSAKIDEERIETRVTAGQRQIFQRAADAQGRSLEEFVIDSVEAAARQVLAEEPSLTLAASQSAAFAEALLYPSRPSPRLQAAARRFLAAHSPANKPVP